MKSKLDYFKKKIYLRTSSPIEERLRVRACSKEPWTVEWIEQMPEGAVLYDVGANVGAYSLLAGKLGHRVVAFEPHPWNYARLVENIALNELGEMVTPFPLALADRMGMQILHLRNVASGSTASTTNRLSKEDSHLPVLGGTLDRFLEDYHGWLPCPTHVKIDVDGSEKLVLQGMLGLIEGGVSLMVEVADDPQETFDMKALLEGFGYDLRGRWDRRDETPPSVVWYGQWGKEAA